MTYTLQLRAVHLSLDESADYSKLTLKMGAQEQIVEATSILSLQYVFICFAQNLKNMRRKKWEHIEIFRAFQPDHLCYFCDAEFLGNKDRPAMVRVQFRTNDKDEVPILWFQEEELELVYDKLEEWTDQIYPDPIEKHHRGLLPYQPSEGI